MSTPFNVERFSKLDVFLRKALDLEGTQRSDYLAVIVAQDSELGASLRVMLEAAERDEESDALTRLLDTGVWAALADDPAIDQRFGVWRILGTLAHGGMARVLLAERADGGFEQYAAIKCLWPGLATPELVARFEQERQILARLDDPRIARLLDGGVRADGVPWLALEYVIGEPIDAHCDSQRLDLDRRLDLWNEVAGAVAAAHRQLVVHRDLKPANVMVSREGKIKLLDFGIAKLLDPQGFPHAAPPTELNARALTRNYASPEQLRGDSVTTASDVYQLGLLLYELATGVQPFRTVNVSAAEHERRILEDDPPPPARAALLDADAPARATMRATTAARLARRLRGDFDAIAMHALAKAPAQRYASVEALQDDIARWRAGLPVRAQRIGVARRTIKWFKRHRLAATVAVALISILVAYATTALMQARALAHEAQINRAVREYLIGWFQFADPGITAGRDPRASEMLEAGLARARRELAEQPEIRAEIFGIVGAIYVARGEYAKAEPILRDAITLRNQTQLRGTEPENAFSSLASVFAFSGRYDEAEPLYRDALAMRVERLGENALWTLAVRQEFADFLHSRGRYSEATAEMERALAGARRAFGHTDSLTANLIRNLADLRRDSGRLDAAGPLYNEALEAQLPALGEIHPNSAAARMGLARLDLDLGRYDEADRQLTKALEVYRKVYGAKHPATAYCERIAAQLEESRGDYIAAQLRLRRLTDEQAANLGPQHILFGYLALDLGFVMLQDGQFDNARERFAEAERIFAVIAPNGHPRLIEIRIGQALLARRRNDSRAADMLLAKAKDQAERDLAPTHPLFAALRLARGETLAGETEGFAVLRVRRALAVNP